MTAATRDRDTQILPGHSRAYPMAAAAVIWAGTIACVDASGNMTRGATSTTLTCVGVAKQKFDNSAGGAGAVNGEAHLGVFGPFANSTSADLIARKDAGKTCYIVDDSTVALTNGSNTRVAAGTIYDVDASGVWVKFS